MNIQTIKLNRLSPATYNPRQISKEELDGLIQSLVTFGQQENLIVNKDMTLISGHQRYKAMEKLGWEEAVCNVVDLTKKQEKKLNVIMNSPAISGKYDNLKLEEILMELRGDDDYESLRLNEIEPLDLSTERISEDDVPELTENPVSKPGEIYQLGEHRLMCGSSTDPKDVERLMNGEKAAMCFTDPPYNVDYQGGMSTHDQNKRQGIMNDKMDDASFYTFLADACKNIVGNTVGAIYICMSSSELDTLKRAFEGSGGHWQSFIIWVKNNFTLSRADYQHTYEPILYGWPKNTKNHYFSNLRDIPNVWEDLREIETKYDGEHTTINFHGFKVKIKGKAEGMVQRKKQKIDIWRHDKPTKSDEHPTMKPVRLCSEAISNSSKMNDIVLDLFGGSGSTLIACQQLGRKCYMMELDPQYVDVIRKRYAKFIGKEAEWQKATLK